MLTAIITYEWHGLLYITAACLLFLVIRPRFLQRPNGRKLLFMGILAALSCAYFGLEEIAPYIYAIHLIPVGIALASLFEGVVQTVITWAVFNICSVFIVGNPVWPVLAASTVLMGLGLWFSNRHWLYSRIMFLTLQSSILIGSYLAVFSLLAPPSKDMAMSRSDYLVAMTGTFLSMVFVNFVYHRMKNQERIQEELAQAAKFQVIGQLAASLSHEIRNPLTTVKGFLQLIKRKTGHLDDLHDYIDHALNGLDCANNIINDYLRYSKPASGNAELLNVNLELGTIQPWIESLAINTGVEVHVEQSTGEPLFIRGESNKFRQCILNLAKNAIESMPQGGHLTIRTNKAEGRVCIEIADTGVGMDEIQLKKLGMPFYTTKEKGTGLGLLVVNDLIKSMGGQIGFKSRINEGTSCVIKFPSVRLEGKERLS